MGSVRRLAVIWTALCLSFEGLGMGALGLAAGFLSQACSEQPDNDYEPVSDACLSCLSEQKKDGCKAQFDACEGVGACDDYVVCQLMGRCFEREPNTGCEEALSCFEPSDEPVGDGGEAESALDLAQAVEKCARSTCAETCGFVED